MKWHPLTLADKPEIAEAFNEDPFPLSDYSFTNLWMWNELRSYQIARIDQFLCIKFQEKGKERFLFPLGKGSRREVIAELAKEHHPLHMRAIPENHPLPYPLMAEPARFDYIYNYEDLVHLPGNRYQAKRNLIHQFTDLYDYTYAEINQELIAKIRSLEIKWFFHHKDVEAEHHAVLRLLEDFEKLNTLGGTLIVQNVVIAFSFAEYLTKEMLVIHAEKASTAFKGAYQMLNQQFLQHLTPVPFVNQEEDLGLPNLRKMKESYHPVRMEKKFTLHIP